MREAGAFDEGAGEAESAQMAQGGELCEAGIEGAEDHETRLDLRAHEQRRKRRRQCQREHER